MLFQSVLFNIQVFCNFLAFFLLLTSSLIPLWSESRRCMISILLNLVRYILWPECGPCWCMFHMSLRRMCVLMLDEVVWRYQLVKLIDGLLSSAMSLLIFYLLFLFSSDRWVLKFSSIIADLSVCPFSFISFASHILMLYCEVYIY